MRWRAFGYSLVFTGATASLPFSLTTLSFIFVLWWLRVFVRVQVNTAPAPPSIVFGQPSRTLWRARSLLMLATPWLTSVVSPPQPAPSAPAATAAAMPPCRTQPSTLTDAPLSFAVGGHPTYGLGCSG